MKFNFNKKAKFDEENLDNIWVVDMWLDNMDSKDGHDHIEFTKIGLIDFLNNEMEDYNSTNGADYTVLDRNATNKEVKEVLYDLLEGKVVEIKPYNEKTANKKFAAVTKQIGRWLLKLVKAGESTNRGNGEFINKGKGDEYDIVEIYDTKAEPGKFTEYGQFVSDYYVSTFLKHNGGLSMVGYVPAWTMSAAEVKEAQEWLKSLYPNGTPKDSLEETMAEFRKKNKTAKKQVKAEKEPKTKIDVLFKLEKPEGIDGLDVVAWFLNDPDTCYSHNGQHSNCYPNYMASLEDAKFTDYEYLLKELENIGYKVNVMNSDYKQQKKASRKFTFNKKKADEETENYITVWLYPGSGASLYGFATVADNEEEALENVADYLVEKQLHSFYMTPQEYQDFMKDFYDDLSEEELEEKMENDETVMYVDTGRGAVVYLTGFENAKIEKGINESYIDDIAIIDGNRAKSGPLSKWSKQASKKVKSSKISDKMKERLTFGYFSPEREKSLPNFNSTEELESYIKQTNSFPDNFFYKGGLFTMDEYDMSGSTISYSSPEIDMSLEINTPDNRYDYKGDYKNMEISIEEENEPLYRNDITYYLPKSVYDSLYGNKSASLKRKAGTGNFATQEGYPLIAIGDEQVYPIKSYIEDYNENNPEEPITEEDMADHYEDYGDILTDLYREVTNEMEHYLKNADIPEGWNITIKPGYYEGVQLWVEEPNDFEYYFEKGWLDDKELGYDELTPEQKAELQNAMQAQYEKEKAQVVQIMIDAAKACGWLQLKVDWRASNGETGYSAVKSGLNKTTMVEGSTLKKKAVDEKIKEACYYIADQGSQDNNAEQGLEDMALEEAPRMFGVDEDVLEKEWDKNRKYYFDTLFQYQNKKGFF